MKATIIQAALTLLILGVTAAPAKDKDTSVTQTTETTTATDAAITTSATETASATTKTKKVKTNTSLAASGTDDAAATVVTVASTKSKKAKSTSVPTGSSDTTLLTVQTTAVSTAAGTAATTAAGTAAGGGGGSLPKSSGTSVLAAAQTIAAGGSFDGGMVMFDRGVSCTGQAEGGDSDAVFQIEAGGSLSNVIIGPNQIEGVHCQGACTLTNVWWSAVCEDAFSIKVQDASATTFIKGGGAFGATDKVIQHNGAGTVDISDFTVDNFGKLYRSCGNCKTSYERHVIMSGVTATSGKELAGINTNFGDTATLTNIKATDVTDICVKFTGTEDNSAEAEINGTGADGTSCIYSDVDIAAA